jgi:P27 family predicted phage terminase small subunit
LILEDEGPICKHVTLDPQTGNQMEKLKAHPAVAISRSAWAQVRSFCSEFGLSPVSRTRLSIEKKNDAEADLMALLSAPRENRPAVN